MKRITVRSYAKINLSLDVLGYTEEGYHEVAMVMQAVRLYDDVSVSWDESAREDGVNIRLHTDLPYVPDDERNIAYKAAVLMSDEYARGGTEDPRGTININIHKRIPVGAGLAGGSGNGAAVIMALDHLWDMHLDIAEMMELGARIGSDVPFCMMSIAAANGRLGHKGEELAATCALAAGRGERLIPKKSLVANVVLCKPPFSVSTVEVYSGIDSIEIKHRPDNDALLAAIESGNKAGIKNNMVNVLENYTAERYDEIKAIKNKIVRISEQDGAVLMTGSGPTVFYVTGNKKKARLVFAEMTKEYQQTYLTRTMV